MEPSDFHGEQVRLVLDVVCSFLARAFTPSNRRLLAKVLTEARTATEAYNAPSAAAARAEAEVRAEKQRRANHVAEWRRNLQKVAPISRWEVAWSPGLGAEWDAMRVVGEWLNGDYDRDWGRPHLFLFGGVGCGKTIAVGSAVKRWVEPGTFDGELPVSWLRTRELVSAVCHAYDPASPRIRRYVVLEDVGMERHEDFEHAMCELLDRSNVTVLATSNLTSAEFRARFVDPRLLSRLQDCAMAVRCKGGSKRRDEGGF